MRSIESTRPSLPECPGAHRSAHHHPITLRVASSSDHAAICDIWESASTLAHPFLSAEERASEHALIRDRFLPVALTWVAEHEGEIVGFLSRVAEEVAGLFVHPAFQRRGIGGLLLERAITPSEEAMVHVYAANAVALDFYRTMGFRPLGWKDADTLGRPYPVVLMARPAFAPFSDPADGDVASVATVETVTADNLPDFAGLFDAYRQFYGQIADMDAATEYLRRRITQGESIVFGARIEGRPVGFAQMYPMWSSVRLSPTLVLNDLYVDPSARGRHVATKLIRACETEGRRRQVSTLSLETQHTNTAAIALYERLGWLQDKAFITFTRSLK